MVIQAFFEQYKSVAIAFSGGVDSAYLLYAAVKYADKVKAYYVKSEFQPQIELDDALHLAKELGVDMQVLTLKVLSVPHVSDNPHDRCYYCKHALFTRLMAAARADGFPVTADGSNASDDAGDRPGMRALRELGVRSPLRECGVTKAEIRRLAEAASLPVWDKPSYACLATRVPAGTKITASALGRVARGEAAFAAAGLIDFRLRLRGGDGLLQVRREQLELARKILPEMRTRLAADFACIDLDRVPREGRET